MKLDLATPFQVVGPRPIYLTYYNGALQAGGGGQQLQRSSRSWPWPSSGGRRGKGEKEKAEKKKGSRVTKRWNGRGRWNRGRRYH